MGKTRIFSRKMFCKNVFLWPIKETRTSSTMLASLVKNQTTQNLRKRSSVSLILNNNANKRIRTDNDHLLISQATLIFKQSRRT